MCAQTSRNLGRRISRSVIHDYNLNLTRCVVTLADAAKTRLQPNRVVANGYDERDSGRHYLVSPIVQSGLTPDGSTLKSLYKPGMLVNISITKATVHTTMYAKKPR